MKRALLLVAVAFGFALLVAAATPLGFLAARLVPPDLLHASDAVVANALAGALLMPAIASIVALVLGGIAALGLWQAAGPARRLVLTLCIFALLLAALHAEAAAFFPAPARPPIAALPGLVVLATPLVVLILSARLRSLDPALLGTAAASGASPSRAFTGVVLWWLAWPSLAALVLCFIATAGDSLIGLARHAPLQ